MKSKYIKWTLIAACSAVFSATAYTCIGCLDKDVDVFSTSSFSQYNKQCTGVIPANKSWRSWLRGNSRSAAFHYYDLVDLLSSQEDIKTANNFVE